MFIEKADECKGPGDYAFQFNVELIMKDVDRDNAAIDIEGLEDLIRKTLAEKLAALQATLPANGLIIRTEVGTVAYETDFRVEGE